MIEEIKILITIHNHEAESCRKVKLNPIYKGNKINIEDRDEFHRQQSYLTYQTL
jgi:hypothetical protein